MAEMAYHPRTLRIEYLNGPLDGVVVEAPEGKAWARWVDPDGRAHFYHLEFPDVGPRYVYQPAVHS